MSRSGYSECEDPADWLYRGAVAQAIRGRRGQRFLRELERALLAMDRPELAAGLVLDPRNGERCAMGAVFAARGLDPELLTRGQLATRTAEILDIAPALAQEIAHENDDWDGYRCVRGPEHRHAIMLRWVRAHIADEPEPEPRVLCGWCARTFVARRGRVGWHKLHGATCPGAGELPAERGVG